MMRAQRPERDSGSGIVAPASENNDIARKVCSVLRFGRGKWNWPLMVLRSHCDPLRPVNCAVS